MRSWGGDLTQLTVVSVAVAGDGTDGYVVFSDTTVAKVIWPAGGHHSGVSVEIQGDP